MADTAVCGGAPPLPVVPPRGLSGIFDDYDPNSILDTSTFPPDQVFLNVYDLGDSEAFRSINRVSTANNNLLIGGLFHASVEVFGVEWCFGHTDDGRSGVASLPPRTHPQHKYRTTVPLGRTKLSEAGVDALLDRMAQEWPGRSYHLIHRNCLNFCNELCRELGVGRIPGWVDRAPRTASFIETTSRTAVESARQTAEVARTMTSEVEQVVRSAMPDAALTESLAAEAEEAQRVTTEAIETMRRETTRLAEVAQTQVQELAETAQELAETAQAQAVQAAQAQAQVLGEAAQKAQEQVHVLSEVVQAHAGGLGGKAQELTDKAQELSEKTQEHARALSTSLWTKVQDLHKVAGGVGGGGAGLWDLAVSGLLGGGPGEPPPAAVLRCPSGHPMRPWTARLGTCDGCGRKVHAGEQVMDCRQCDWYFCEGCTAAATGVAVRDAGPGAGSPPAEAASAPAAAGKMALPLREAPPLGQPTFQGAVVDAPAAAPGPPAEAAVLAADEEQE